jgi:uncharacterized protein YjbI with pentapeptide repeats
MEFRSLPHQRSIQRPSFDAEDLTDGALALKGEFDVHELRTDRGDLSGITGEGRLARVSVSDTSLADTVLGPLQLDDSRFTDIDLSNAHWHKARMRRTEFLKCRAIGWRLDLTLAHDVYLEKCRLDYAVLRLDKVQGLTVFAGCSLREAVIAGDLSNTVFTDCDLTGAEFRATRATGCDLRGSRVATAHGLLTLRGAILTAEEAISAAMTIAADAGLTVID